MAILCLGVSFRRAPFDLLERLTLADDDLHKAYLRALDADAIEEAVILSTCNRVEVYANVPAYHAGFLALKRVLAESGDVAVEELAEPLYSHYEHDAADHLFAVAAGLDSMVLGETQIASQVREAAKRSEAEGASGPRLKALFHAANRAGRRVRAETSLGVAPDAFVALGADLAADELGSLEGANVVVVGAGQMASLAVRHFRARGVGRVRILNRSPERARALAMRSDGAEHGPLDGLRDALDEADLVVSATGAAGTVIPEKIVRLALASRERPLVLLDLAVPHDVDPDVVKLEGARLIDVVTLRGRIAEHDEETASGIARAHEIVGEEVRRWVRRKRADALAPLITAIRTRGDEVVRAELERSAPRLADLTPDERTAVEAMARAIVAKLLHDPIVALKERAESGPEHARLLAELLGIDPASE
ncbi:MAG TPA: glutamyl-tRNA reductase [Actinomycetota bacterium]